MPNSIHRHSLSWSSDGSSETSAGQPVSPDFLHQVEMNQVYALIDTILPFEACLYYQVLPLFIEGSRLIIGVVYPDDPAAIQYVTKQLSYINYSLVFKPIPSDWHRDLLSRYLSHASKKRQPEKRVNKPEPTAVPPSRGSQRKPAVPDRTQQKTLIVDQPEQLLVEEALAETAIANTPPPTNQDMQLGDDASDASTSGSPSPDVSANVKADPAPLHLQIDPQYREIPDTQLITLQPKALMQALLGKVLEEGIGRLYFERHSTSGRILWSRDGILQAVVDPIDGQVFQGVINEFKLLTHLSLIPVKKPKQVEIERLVEQERVLLRYKVMPNAYGEEATLQVLRGTALRFYQQQQLEKLGRDALDAAQVLQLRLNEMRDRARSSLSFRPANSDTLPTLIDLLRQMEAQVAELVAVYGNDPEATDGQNTQPTVSE